MKRHLVDVDPENTVWQVEFIITLTALGDGQLALQKPNDALVSDMEANRSAQTLIKQDPKNSFWQQQLLYSDLGLIKAKHAQGDAQGARAAAQDALNVIAIIETLDLRSSATTALRSSRMSTIRSKRSLIRLQPAHDAIGYRR